MDERKGGGAKHSAFFTCMETESASCALRDANCPHPTNGVHSSFWRPSSVGTVESESFALGIWNEKKIKNFLFVFEKKAKYNMHNIQHNHRNQSVS